MSPCAIRSSGPKVHAPPRAASFAVSPHTTPVLRSSCLQSHYVDPPPRISDRPRYPPYGYPRAGRRICSCRHCRSATRLSSLLIIPFAGPLRRSVAEDSSDIQKFINRRLTHLHAPSEASGFLVHSPTLLPLMCVYDMRLLCSCHVNPSHVCTSDPDEIVNPNHRVRLGSVDQANRSRIPPLTRPTFVNPP